MPVRREYREIDPSVVLREIRARIIEPELLAALDRVAPLRLWWPLIPLRNVAFTAIVLATYMSGLLLGSALLGPWADRIKRPLRAYAGFELAIGLWALALPALTAMLGALLVRFFANRV